MGYPEIGNNNYDPETAITEDGGDYHRRNINATKGRDMDD